MKYATITTVMLCIAIVPPVYCFAAAPCEVVLCMYGKATGNSGGSECYSAEKTFFNIVKRINTDFYPVIH